MGEDVICGDGMTERVRNALHSVVRQVVPAMFKSQQPWALMGSTCSVLQGIDGYTPPDIDLVTTMQGAYIMQGAVACCGATVRPVSWSVSPPYESHFGIFEVDDVKVEVMGDLVIRCDDGVISAAEHFARWSDKVRVLHFQGYHIPAVRLEWQLVANVLLRRPERSIGIAHLLLRNGYDREYVDALLSDQHIGERTIATVRRMLQVD
jgi:hypothetical protein